MTQIQFIYLNSNNFQKVCRFYKDESFVDLSLQLQAAEKYHVKGVILYPDPEQYCPTGRPYPETMFMPGDGTQRGTSLHKRGDPLSRGYPAKGKHRFNRFGKILGTLLS